MARFVAAALLLIAGSAPLQNLAPFIPTPEDVVARMLTLAEVTREDVVFDLGCGDGRIRYNYLTSEARRSAPSCRVPSSNTSGAT